MLKRRFSKGSYWDKRANLAHQQVAHVPRGGQVISPPTAGPEPGPEKGGKWGGEMKQDALDQQHRLSCHSGWEDWMGSGEERVGSGGVLA